ncbi:EAL and GGDEF domain-containing protein [Bacillus suaedae]|uniref:EAL domain-containing protein n=1 Tax=Halalkalibacter suaedae TaxID=2822140 RepID=A0A940WSB2_9BACI|nr:EAL domain-containing protein [Bacillus suaedae]MBP3951575.1 EAL domain-containing protein [Bacillus suaedae]
MKDVEREVFDVTFNTILDGIIVTDKWGAIIQVNDGFSTLFGWSKNMVLGKTVMDLQMIPEQVIADYKALVDRAHLGEKINCYSMKQRTKASQLIDITLSITPIYNHEGQLSYITMILRDVSETLNLQDELIHITEKYKSLFRYQPNMIFLLTTDFEWMDFNDQVVTNTGIKRSQITKSNFITYFHKDDHEEIINSLNKAIEGGHTETLSLLKHIDGGYQTVRMSFFPCNSKGQVNGVFVVANDESEQQTAKDKLRNAQTELEMIYHNTTDGIFSMGHDGGVLDVNKPFTKMLGWELKEIRNPAENLIPQEELKFEIRSKLLKNEAVINKEVKRIHKNGEIKTILASYQPVQHDEIFAVGVYKDITNEAHLRQQLKLSAEHYKSLFYHNYDCVYTLDINGGFLECNPATEKVTGYTVEEFLTVPFESIIAIEDLEKVNQTFAQAVNGISKSYECTIVTKSRKRRTINVTNVPMIIDGQVKGVFGIAKDITDQRKREREIHEMAYYDQLTKLANRSLFTDRLNQAWQRVRKERTLMALLYLDLDGFKLVNDSLGHDVGDQLLIDVSERIKQVVPDTATFARKGGDEFAVLLPTIKHTAEALRCAKEILEALKIPFIFQEFEFHITTSIGITYYSGDPDVSTQTLVKQADWAMYHVKDHNKNGYAIYNEQMNKKALRRVVLETNLREAIANEDFFLEYQPIIELSTGSIVGMEVLVRWDHASLGTISPGEFIPLAEETGLIIPLGEWILREACLQTKRWQLQGLQSLRVSINVSVRQLQQQGRFVDSVKRILDEVELETKWIDFEITETALMKNEEEMIGVLNEIKSLGINISIDDFGTGYSSMYHLKSFSVDTLKIDCSFIGEMHTNPKSKAIVTSIIKLAQALNLKTIAEGVEVGDQLRLLSSEKANAIQGYYFSPPVSSKEFENYLLEGYMFQLNQKERV